MNEKLSLEGLIFQATKIDIDSNVLTITLNRPEKKNALNNVMSNEICYALSYACLLYTSPSPRDRTRSRMPSSA